MPFENPDRFGHFWVHHGPEDDDPYCRHCGESMTSSDYRLVDCEKVRAGRDLIRQLEEVRARPHIDSMFSFRGWVDGRLCIDIYGLGEIRLRPHHAVQYANAILSEVEIYELDGDRPAEPDEFF